MFEKIAKNSMFKANLETFRKSRLFEYNKVLITVEDPDVQETLLTNLLQKEGNDNRRHAALTKVINDERNHFIQETKEYKNLIKYI